MRLTKNDNKSIAIQDTLILPEIQRLKWEDLCKIGNIDNSQVLEVACGLGEMKSYLHSRFSNFSYTGVDTIPEFIHLNKEACKLDATTKFVHSSFLEDPLPIADYTFAVDAFSFLPDSYNIHRVIRKLYSTVQRGLAMNFLDAAQHPFHKVIVSYNKYEILSSCLRMGDQVEMIENEQYGFFTLLMRRK